MNAATPLIMSDDQLDQTVAGTTANWRTLGGQGQGQGTVMNGRPSELGEGAYNAVDNAQAPLPFNN